MSLLVIFLSYLLGCASTIALLIYLYIRYGLYTSATSVEQEQYQTFHPLPENGEAKNSTVDAINYLFQFLFQELKDTSKLRRYIMHKLNIEFDELKNTRIGKIFIQDIVIQSFSLGKECPIFNDIQLERQERDERHLIKKFIVKLYADYKDGFSLTLNITLAFGHKCQLYIKVKRIKGHLRLEFRREPFSHWLIVFQNEPYIDFEIKSYLTSRESPQLAQIIHQQIRRAIRRKQTWPSYKIRYQPFFPTSKQSLPTEILSVNNNKLIPGKFNIQIKYCDRLSIPFGIFNKEKSFLLSVFLTININEHICQDYLHINRDQWIKKDIEFIPKIHKINIKEVLYMERNEFLIEEFAPIPNEIEDIEAFKIALEDKNIFLLQIQNQEVKTLKQINRLLKYKTTNKNEQKIQIVIGMPLLHSVRLRRAVETSDTNETEEIDEQSSTTLRQRTSVKFDESIDSISNQSENSIQHEESDFIKTKNSSADNITLIMMNADFLQELDARLTPTRKAEAYIEFGDEFEFQVGPDEQYLNICLWCKPPLDWDVPNPGKKLILLGYATVALSEIVLDAHMSFKRETQMTLNFRSVYLSKSNLHEDLTDSESKKLTELSTHKGYDDNMTHGFVTINIKHQPDIEIKLNQDDKKERSISLETTFNEKDDEQKQEQLKSINEKHELPSSKSIDHIFEDQSFNVVTLCAYCNKKIWMKVGRQCRNCSITVHKKCEEKYNIKNTCTHESIHLKPTVSEDDYSTISTDDTTVHRFSTKTAISVPDSTVRRSFLRFGNKNVNQIPTLTLSELPKNDELDNNSLTHTEKRLSSNSPVQTSSKFFNVASSAFNKWREFKSKQTSTLETNNSRLSSDSTVNEDISEADLQDIITRCLSDENIDEKSLEQLFHEKSVDHTTVYAKANEFGSELFPDLTYEERKQKLDNEISRLQQEIDLQDRIRDEMIIEYNNHLTDENTKRKIQAKIDNTDEKIQALAALTIFYCSSLRYCCSQLKTKDDNHSMNSKTLNENNNNQLNDNSDK